MCPLDPKLRRERNNIIDIRTHKTCTKNRGHYIYYFSNGEKHDLVPGKDGVTEGMIRQLHLADDREVESNNNYYTVKTVKGASGKKEDITKIYLASFEQIFKDPNNNNNNLMFEASVFNPADTSDKLIAQLSLKEFIETRFTEHQQKIVVLMYHGYKATEIAKILGISDAAITKTKKRIAQIFSEYKINC